MNIHEGRVKGEYGIICLALYLLKLKVHYQGMQ